MSSFIIGKKEFIKAAGLMCGYEEAKSDSHKWFIDNVRKEFEHAYALNVVSVNEQYGDGEMPSTTMCLNLIVRRAHSSSVRAMPPITALSFTR